VNDDYGTEFTVSLYEQHSYTSLHALAGESTAPVVGDTMSINGIDSISVSRSGLSGGAGCDGNGDPTGCTCPTGPCPQWGYVGAYTLLGTEYVRVVLAPQPTLTVTADADTVSWNTNVTFTRTVSPSQFGSQTYSVSNPQWTYAGTGFCYGGGSCSTSVQQTGWAKFEATINGQDMADSVYVVVR
jgi:hypothetical protein